MASVLVVADDLTGANATGARFARVGLRTVTATSPDEVAAFITEFDAVVSTTSSRHLAPDEAARRVAHVIETSGDVPLVVKRTDTTLRGNVGAEIEAALEQVRRRHPEARAIFVPAFADAGRITVGGLQLVDDVAVARSAAGTDPRGPVTSSRVADILHQQSDLTVAEVHLDVVQGAEEGLVEAVAQAVDVLIVDSTDRRDLSTIAQAAALCSEKHGVHWLSVDPGPFGPELAIAMRLNAGGDAAGDASDQMPPLLVVSGSVSRSTREQLVVLEQVHDASFVDVDITAIDESAVIDRVVELLEHAPAGGVVGLRTAADESEVVPLSDQEASDIPRRLGAMVRQVLERLPLGGVYVTGGDVTIGLVEALGGTGIAIDAEVLPLAVTGRLVGGEHEGLRLVTKGGLIGDRTAAVTCVDELRHRSIDDRKAGT